MKHLTLLLLTFLISSVNAQHNYKSIEGFEVFNVNDSLQGSHAMKLSDVLNTISIYQNSTHHVDSNCIVLNLLGNLKQTCFAKCCTPPAPLPPTTSFNPIVSNSLPAPNDNDQGCPGSWTSRTLTITGTGLTTVNLTGSGPWDLYAEVCGLAADNSLTSLTLTRTVNTACGTDTETLTFPITVASGIITNVGSVGCVAPFDVCTDCSSYSFKHAQYDWGVSYANAWQMIDIPALVVPGATHDQTTTSGTLEYSINGDPFIAGPAGTVTPTELKLSLLPFTEIQQQSITKLRWTSTNGLVNEVVFLRGYTEDQIGFTPPYSQYSLSVLQVPQFYTNCPAYGIDYLSYFPYDVTIGSSQAWTDTFMCGQTITLNGSSISPTYATSLGLCLLFGTQTASATNYVNGINTFIVNHSATGPNVNISYRTDVFLQCN